MKAFLRILLLLSLALLTQAAAWKKILDEKDLKLFHQRVEGSNLMKFRGEGLLRAPPEKVCWNLSDFDTVKMLMEQSGVEADIRVLEAEPNRVVLYNRVNLPWPISDRDAVVEVTYQYDRDRGQIVINGRSTEHPKAPGVTNQIRVQMEARSVLDFAEDPNVTVFRNSMHSDPGGWIPDWLVNFITKRQVIGMVRDLRAHLKTPAARSFPSFATNGFHPESVLEAYKISPLTGEILGKRDRIPARMH